MRLRGGRPPIFTRVHHGQVLVDPRTLLEGEEAVLVEAFVAGACVGSRVDATMARASEQINITLGTAGHIDHGKTALVKCLTGCDTDRLKEEKERGMSIELGFAPCKIADTQVGIVDVPGHENFIKTMVAGASGMDAVILVVAADDGVMPQTREHLDILTLLGIRQGIVALTKIDRVAARRAGKRAGPRWPSFLQGTFLEAAPILPLSNVTGEGFDPFLEALWSLVRSIEPRPVDGVFRLPLERGVLGTRLWHGRGRHPGVRLGPCRRRGGSVAAETHRPHPADRGLWPGGRRGDGRAVRRAERRPLGPSRDPPRRHALTVPGFFCAGRVVRLLGPAAAAGKIAPEEAGRKSASTPARPTWPPCSIRSRATRCKAACEGLMQVRTKAPVVAGPGDHFILRTPSPVRTIGGGRIVEAVARRLKGSRPNVVEDLTARAEAIGDECRFVEYCVRRGESPAVSEPAWPCGQRFPTAACKRFLPI